MPTLTLSHQTTIALLKERGSERAGEREQKKNRRERNGEIVERSFQTAPLMCDGTVTAERARKTFAFHLYEQNNDQRDRDNDLDDIDKSDHSSSFTKTSPPRCAVSSHSVTRKATCDATSAEGFGETKL